MNRWWFLSQQTTEASYLLPKTFGNWYKVHLAMQALHILCPLLQDYWNNLLQGY
jgi:hypothetical protein